MTNKQFAALVMELRDEAVVLVAERQNEIERWDKVAYARVFEWFGNPGLLTASAYLHEMRAYLRNGLNACERVLRGLRPENFVRWSSTAHRHLNCINSRSAIGLVAEVCKPDIKTRTIAIAPLFCQFPRDNKIFGTETSRDTDSQLLTLLHEITHFDDVFASTDEWYGTRLSRMMALDTSQMGKARANADSIAGYILGVKQ